jgi:hypothetical protein
MTARGSLEIRRSRLHFSLRPASVGRAPQKRRESS